MAFIVYRKLSNPYSRFVRPNDGWIWDVTNEVMAAAPTWTNTDIATTYDSNIGGYPIVVPSDLPAGDYDWLLYDNSSPANTDVVLIGKRIAWSGNDLIGLPIDL